MTNKVQIPNSKTYLRRQPDRQVKTNNKEIPKDEITNDKSQKNNNYLQTPCLAFK